MARFIYLDGVDEAALVRFPGQVGDSGYEVTSAAETASVNTGRIEIDDLAGSLNVVPRKGAYIVETAAPSNNQRIWTGYIQNATIDRGPYRNGASRVWRADCVDLNFDLTRRAISSGKRGAETDIARITWLLANAALTGLVYSGTLTNLTDNVKNLDEADYTDQKPMDVLADIAPQCGKRAFVFYNESTARAELFYDLADASVNASSSKISNVVSDLTIVNGAPSGGVWPPFIDGSLERLGEEIASKWRLRWVGGVTTQTRTDTLATYGEYEFATESTRIGRASTAAAWVAAQLTAHQGPQDTLTCTLLLPPANVNDIKEGQRLQVKFSHLPDLTAYTYRRVISRIIKVDPSDNYLVQLVLDNATGTAVGGGGTGIFPQPSSAPPDLVQYKIDNSGSITLDAAPTVGNILIGWSAIRVGTWNTTDQFTSIASITEGVSTRAGQMVYRLVQSGDTASGPPAALGWDSPNQGTSILMEFSGDTIDTFASLSNQTSAASPTTISGGGSVTPTAGVPAVVVAGVALTDGDLDIVSVTPASGVTELLDQWADQSPYGWVGYKTVSSTSGSYTISGSATNSHEPDIPWGGVTVVITSSAGSAGNPPQPGQWVYGETPTPTPGGGNTVFYAAFAYAVGSLQVFVDNVDQTAAVTESDPTTGQFTLAFDPRSWETLLVNYQGAAG